MKQNNRVTAIGIIGLMLAVAGMAILAKWMVRDDSPSPQLAAEVQSQNTSRVESNEVGNIEQAETPKDDPLIIRDRGASYKIAPLNSKPPTNFPTEQEVRALQEAAKAAANRRAQ